MPDATTKTPISGLSNDPLFHALYVAHNLLVGTTSNTRAVLALAAVALLAGCASAAPYKDALHRFGAAGRAIQPHLKPAGDDSVEALYEAFDAAVKEAEAVK